MSLAHYSDNPTDFTEHSLDANQVTIDIWTNLTALSRAKSPFASLAEQASITSYEPNAQLKDTTPNNSAPTQGDSEMSSTGSSSSTSSVTECVGNRIPESNPTQSAPRHRLWHQDHKRRISSRERQVAGDLRRYYNHKGHEALLQQEHPHEERMAQQQWEANQRLRVEATGLAAQTSTQMHAEFRAMEYDACVEMDELKRIEMLESAIKPVKNIPSSRKQGKKSDDVKNAAYTLVTNLESKLHTQSLESSTSNSIVKAIEAHLLRRLHCAQMECRDHVQRYDEFKSESAFLAPDRHRWKDHESFLALEVRKQEQQYHGEATTAMQKDLEVAIACPNVL